MKEEIKKSILKYFENTSKHTFVSKLDENKFLKVFIEDDKIMILSGKSLHEISMDNINNGIDIYEKGYKNIQKTSLFSTHEFVAIKSNRFIKEKVKEILSNMKERRPGYFVYEKPLKKSILEKIISALGF